MSKESKEAVLAAVDARLNEEWAAKTMEALMSLARRKKFIIVDDLWGLIDPPPSGLNSDVGAVMRRAASAERGILKGTAWRTYSERGNHDNIMLWKSLIFQAGDAEMPEVVSIRANPEFDLRKAAIVLEAAQSWYESKRMTGTTFTDEFDQMVEVIYETFEADEDKEV